MSVIVVPASDDDRTTLRFVTPVLVLLVGVVGVAVGLIALRSFDAGTGTCMVLLALWMLWEERRG